MSIKRRRIQVTPSDEVWALVDEVHGLTGTPKAAILSEILDNVAPVFTNQIHALRMLKESPREAQRLMQNFANESIGKLAQSSLELDAEIEAQSSLDLDSAIDARTVKGARKRRAGGRPNP
jgi:hypothetical protein